MYSPDGIERSRASANCAGSYLHSPWWSQQAYAYTTPANPFANALGGALGGLGQGNYGWWQGLFGTRNIP